MAISIGDRKLRMVMIGGGPGSGIGRVHRMGGRSTTAFSA